MNFLGFWLVIVAEIYTSASVRIKENKADKQFANAEYDKALEVYIDLAKAYDEDSLVRYDLDYIDSIGTYDDRYVRLIYKIIDCNSKIHNKSFETEYSNLAYFIANHYTHSPFAKGFEKETIILLVNSHKNAKEFYEAFEYCELIVQNCKGVGDDIKLNYIDYCIEENRIIPALNTLKEVKAGIEKQDRLNKCYNFLSNNTSTCLEIGDTLCISKSMSGCIYEPTFDECFIIRLKEGYELLKYNKIIDENVKQRSFELDTLISEDFYNKVIDFELLIKTQEYKYKELSRFESRFTEQYYFSLKGINQSYSIKGFLDFDPELERVLF